jgi:hypothetical protein
LPRVYVVRYGCISCPPQDAQHGIIAAIPRRRRAAVSIKIRAAFRDKGDRGLKSQGIMGVKCCAPARKGQGKRQSC